MREPARVPAVIGYVHIPKTGGSTMKYVLRNSFGIRHCDVRAFDADGIFKARDLVLARRVHPFGLRSIAGHDLVRPSAHLPESVRCFTFLRDPVKRAASAYQHHVRGRHRIRLGNPLLSLEEYLEIQTSGVNRQVRQLSPELDIEAARREIDRCFFVGLVEDFESSLEMLAALSPYPIDTNYQLRNVAPDDRVKQEILADPLRRKRIEQATLLDQELYAYARDVIYPAQRERAAEAAGRARRRRHAVGRCVPAPRACTTRSSTARCSSRRGVGWRADRACRLRAATPQVVPPRRTSARRNGRPIATHRISAAPATPNAVR